MNVKKFVLAWVTASVVGFLLGGLWHLFLLADFYEAQHQGLAREEPNMLFVILGSEGRRGGNGYPRGGCLIEPRSPWLSVYQRNCNTSYAFLNHMPSRIDNDSSQRKIPYSVKDYRQR